jgi:hypothetical protein
MFVRRVYAKTMLPRASHLEKRVEEAKSGKFEKELEELSAKDTEEVKKVYVEREREPDLAEPGKWMPEDKKHL